MSAGVISQAAIVAITAYIESKAAALDGDPELRSLTIILRWDKRSGQLVPTNISHRIESQGYDIHTPARTARAAVS